MLSYSINSYHPRFRRSKVNDWKSAKKRTRQKEGRFFRAGEMIPEVEGLGLGGPRGKGSPSVSKGPKPPIQLLQLLKNSPTEVKRAHFRYILGPPGPTQEMELMGPGGEGPSRSPRFLQPWCQKQE